MRWTCTSVSNTSEARPCTCRLRIKTGRILVYLRGAQGGGQGYRSFGVTPILDPRGGQNHQRIEESGTRDQIPVQRSSEEGLFFCHGTKVHIDGALQRTCGQQKSPIYFLVVNCKRLPLLYVTHFIYLPKTVALLQLRLLIEYVFTRGLHSSSRYELLPFFIIEFLGAIQNLLFNRYNRALLPCAFRQQFEILSRDLSLDDRFRQK